MALSPTAATIPMSGRTTSRRRGAERRPSVAEVLWVLPPKCRHHDYARPSTTSIGFTCNCYLAVGQPAFPPNWGPAAGCPGSWTAGCGRTSGIQSHSNPACSSRSGTEPARPCFKHCSWRRKSLTRFPAVWGLCWFNFRMLESWKKEVSDAVSEWLWLWATSWGARCYWLVPSKFFPRIVSTEGVANVDRI